MKVEHLAPVAQDELAEALTGLDEQAAIQSKPRQTSQDPSQREQEKLDTDLAFERDELLRQDVPKTKPHGPKVWQVKDLNLKLSALEATVAVKGGVFTYDDFSLYVQSLPQSP